MAIFFLFSTNPPKVYGQKALLVSLAGALAGFQRLIGGWWPAEVCISSLLWSHLS